MNRTDTTSQELRHAVHRLFRHSAQLNLYVNTTKYLNPERISSDLSTVKLCLDQLSELTSNINPKPKQTEEKTMDVIT